MRLSLMLLTLCISIASALGKTPGDFVSAREMLADVQNEHNRTYLQGVWGGLQLANVSLEENHQTPLFCQPPKLEIPLDQVISILKRYIGNDHSMSAEAISDLPVEFVLLDALQDVFPCHLNKNPKAQ
jgi:hypothetical protein